MAAKDGHSRQKPHKKSGGQPKDKRDIRKLLKQRADKRDKNNQ